MFNQDETNLWVVNQGLKKWIEVGNSGVFRPEMLLPMGLPEDVAVIAWGLSLERWVNPRWTALGCFTGVHLDRRWFSTVSTTSEIWSVQKWIWRCAERIPSVASVQKQQPLLKRAEVLVATVFTWRKIKTRRTYLNSVLENLETQMNTLIRTVMRPSSESGGSSFSSCIYYLN